MEEGHVQLEQNWRVTVPDKCDVMDSGMDSEGGVEPDGDRVRVRQASYVTGYLNMDSRFSDKRRRGPQVDG